MSAGTMDWQRHFLMLADVIEERLAPGEMSLTTLAAEDSDFVRFNAGKVRQIGHVSQGTLTVRLIEDERQAYSTLTICGDSNVDRDAVAGALDGLREALRDASPDPHLLVDTSTWTQTTQRRGTLPEIGSLLSVVERCAAGLLAQDHLRLAGANEADAFAGKSAPPTLNASYAQRLAQIRADGIDTALSRPVPGIDTLAAPVFDHTGSICLVLALMGPSGSFDSAAAAGPAQTLRAATLRLSRRFGWMG